MRSRKESVSWWRRGMGGCLTVILLVTLSVHVQAAEHADGSNEGEHGHRHHAALFLGNTHSDAEGEDAFTAGIDYEFRFGKLLGAGALYDYAGGDLESHIGAVALFVHPVGNLRLLAGFGVEHKNEEGESHGEGEHAAESEHEENKFLVRVGVLYDWHIGRCSISPTLAVDFVDGEEAYVYGVSFGFGF